VSFLSTWATALRVARREARRAKGRSALVILMIAVPVMALVFAAASYDMFRLTPAEKADRAMGTADARVRWDFRGPVDQNIEGDASPRREGDTGDTNQPGQPVDGAGPPTDAELLAKLPAGSTAVPLRRGTARLRTAEGLGDLNAVIVDAAHPMTRGYVEVIEGRAPRDASEVGLTAEAVQRLGQGIGGTITTGDGAHPYRVVGLVEFPSSLEQFVLFAPAAGPVVQRYGGLDRTWLVDTPEPLDWARVLELNQHGIVVASRTVLADPPEGAPSRDSPPVNVTGRDLSVGIVVGGLGLLEVVLLAGPAFAVSARRRQRQLALVAANGGTPAHVRRIVLADGVVLGLAGAGVGILLGILGAFVARPFLEEYLANARAGGYRVYPLALAVIAGLAVVTGLLAALVPAFVTARQDVVASLAGRRGITRSRKRWLVLGGGMAAGGAAITAAGAFTAQANLILAGLVLGELGLVLCTPTLVGLIARLGPVVPLAARVALRDAARNRAAAAPAISAVMAAVAGSVAIGLYFASEQAAFAEQTTPLPIGTVTVAAPPSDAGPPDLTAVEATVRSVLPVTAFHQLTQVACPAGSPADQYCDLSPEVPPDKKCPYADAAVGTRILTTDEARAARRDRRCDNPYLGMGRVYVDDGTVLAAITDASADDLASATAMLRSGGIVVRDATFVRDGRVTVAIVRGDPTNPDPATWLANATRMSLPAYALSTGNPGAPFVISPSVVAQAGLATQPANMIVDTTRPPTQAEIDRAQLQLEPLQAFITIEQAWQTDVNILLWILAGAAGIITLGAAAIATGLAAADGRADLSTLAAVGASPRLRRGLSLSQSGVIAGLGSMLGAAAGTGAAVAIVVAMNQRWSDVWPGPPLMPITFPWPSLTISLLVVPLVAMLGAGLLTRSRLPIERRL
jgi:putative ABC transport system permease protein